MVNLGNDICILGNFLQIKGVDIYFDIVGGAISDGVIENINTYGHVVACGSISNYNDVGKNLSPSLLPMVVYKFLRIQGFLIADSRANFPKGKEQTAKLAG